MSSVSSWDEFSEENQWSHPFLFFLVQPASNIDVGGFNQWMLFNQWKVLTTVTAYTEFWRATDPGVHVFIMK